MIRFRIHHLEDENLKNIKTEINQNQTSSHAITKKFHEIILLIQE